MIVYKKIYEYLENKERLEYAKLIDYTKISNNLSNDNIKEICKEAENNSFYSICLLPEHVSTAYSFSKGDVKISALIDFPQGTSDTKIKINSIDECVVNGASEVDVVVNYNLIKDSEERETLKEEIRALAEYCNREGVNMKAIIEIGALSYQEIEDICKICVDSNVEYLMTSTGKLPKDDSFEEKLEKVKFMRKILPEEIKIKFAGGVRSVDQIKQLSTLVDRIGTSVIPQ